LRKRGRKTVYVFLEFDITGFLQAAKYSNMRIYAKQLKKRKRI